jgi:TrpR-related protein YerC/YecD
MPFNKDKNEAIELFFAAVKEIDERELAADFFDDLMTVNELSSFSQRLLVARMLLKGNTYQRIEEATGVSTATISRVKRILFGGKGGLRKVLERLEAEENK